MKYDVQHFIDKFEAIPEHWWCTGTYSRFDGTQKCAMGHCGRADSCSTDEADALFELFDSYGLDVPLVNDGDARFRSRYPHDHPKKRILAALHDIKNGELDIV